MSAGLCRAGLSPFVGGESLEGNPPTHAAAATHHQLPTAHQLQLGYQVNKVLVEQAIPKKQERLVLAQMREKLMVVNWQYLVTSSSMGC